MIGLKVSDFSLLHWESDWNGDEVGLDCEVAGLWRVPASDRSPELYLYVDAESCEVLEVWTLADAEDEVDGYEEFDNVECDSEEDLEGEKILGDWYKVVADRYPVPEPPYTPGAWTPGGGAVDDSTPLVVPVDLGKAIDVSGLKIVQAENGGVWIFLGGGDN